MREASGDERGELALELADLCAQCHPCGALGGGARRGPRALNPPRILAIAATIDCELLAWDHQRLNPHALVSSVQRRGATLSAQ
jgi:hypothetical protein